MSSLSAAVSLATLPSSSQEDEDFQIEADLDAEANSMTAPADNDMDTNEESDIATLLRDKVLDSDHIHDVAQAYAAWIEASEITHGYLFRKIAPGDRIVKDQNEPMTSADFLEMFRNHLIDIGVDPYPYTLLSSGYCSHGLGCDGDDAGSGSGSSPLDENSSGSDRKVFECGIWWDTLYKQVMWLKKKSCPLCRTNVREQPIRDCALEVELEAAIVEGRVAQVDERRITDVAYEWADVKFVSA
ncbi:hypothetical protein B0H14DRAFT_3539066 [Mycena olivaceomarginata]|nr:hypothetical protein B0H14DRAFT_3539066 [Mycena olivaceomarginata]